MAVHEQQHGIGQMSHGELRRTIEQQIQDQPTPKFRREGRGAVPPTQGTWSLGDVWWNSMPASGGFIGWVCVGPGTPGTWTEWGPIV